MPDRYDRPTELDFLDQCVGVDTSLPKHLEERFRRIEPAASLDAKHRGQPGDYVMYWMHHALRAHENPALDTAICLARQNGLPLLVYHGLSEQYPYASDRLHAFMLQGHRDVQRELSDRGIRSVFHLQRQGRRGPYLRDLTRSAAFLVTEEMPVQPVSGWIERLVTMTDTPIATVDCSCIAPVTLSRTPIDNVDDYRSHVAEPHRQRITLPYPEQSFDVEVCDLHELRQQIEIDPLCLQDANLAELIGQCRIDHSVAPVTGTPGGSRAGYLRWKKYVERQSDEQQLPSAQASLQDRSSRLSAYLHYGMVSPLRVAREAHEQKLVDFLEELLIWRELAFQFCYHHRETVDTLDAVPEWARETLDHHAKDPRDENCSWETLARARSGRPLWDAAQRSLIKHGELDHNVRMTWGKALLPWAHSPERALHLTLDLNHRYALDGRNPSSYGGVLWCFGQFDEPSKTEVPVLGKLRPRCVEKQLQNIDFPRFKATVDRPIAARGLRVAVIGAGLGGLIAARTLADHGIDVAVFDKSRGVGGRMSTRRAVSEIDQSTIHFDHGAQYFTARDSRFCRMVNSWMHDGIVQPWLGRIVSLDSGGHITDEKRSTSRYVGTPGMNALAKHLSDDLTLHLGSRVVELSRTNTAQSLDANCPNADSLQTQHEQWELRCDPATDQAMAVLEPFDVVLTNCPPLQTLALIDGHTDLSRQIESVQMRPCWAMMVASDSLTEMPYDAAFVNDSPISWIASNNDKPQRDGSPAWTIHASADWSEEHVDDSPETVMELLSKEFEKVTGKTIGQTHYHKTHRWLYAIPETPLENEFLFDATTGIGVCGDWCGGKRVEAAFLSGAALAGAVLRHHTIDRAPFRAEVS